jgi:SOS-response transcriptional repressor LexA
MKPNAGLFGAMDVDYVVTLDACTGETAKYKPTEAPEWIDIVYYGTLVCEKFDWYGMLREGYLNSAFSQTNCVVTTDDFGYKIIGNDVYIFTGVTSTSNDEANIGFILANSRTGEYSFYSVPGAEEYSAMAAAEGSVQQYRYTASFPSLINVDGEATYIMVLKDASGIVKMYSMVNVENYNIVVTSDTQADVFQKYKAALAGSGKKPEADVLESEEITVRDNTRTREADYALRISGNSMEPRYRDGDILLVQETDTLEFGELGIFILDGSGFFKVFGGDRLYSLNPEYGDILLKDFEDVRIAGRVIGKLRKR